MNTSTSPTSTVPFGWAAEPIERNERIPLDMGLINSITVNDRAMIARAGDIVTRRSVKKEHQMLWDIKTLNFTDHTTLKGDDTPGNNRRVAAKAIQPIPAHTWAELKKRGIGRIQNRVAAVCCHHKQVEHFVELLDGTDIPVAAVSTGFPDSQLPHDLMLKQIEASVENGAAEIDIVLTREYALLGDWHSVYDQVVDFREACGPAHMKVILGTGNLGTFDNVAKASMVSMMAGADFIKTSTGKEPLNATHGLALCMIEQIRDYYHETGYKVGFKPAGGISTTKVARPYGYLMKDKLEPLSSDWLTPDLFRIGASSLTNDAVRQIQHQLTGQYPSPHHTPMG